MSDGGEKRQESVAARRRRIEKMREKRELMSLLDDFGDGDLDLELDLDEDEEEESSRYVAASDDSDNLDGDDNLDDGDGLDDDLDDDDDYDEPFDDD